MKRILIISVIMVAVTFGGVNYAVNYVEEDNINYVAKVQEVVETIVEVEDVDVIDSARIELERITNELDVEEQSILDEIEILRTRLEELNTTRSSFQ